MGDRTPRGVLIDPARRRVVVRPTRAEAAVPILVVVVVTIVAPLVLISGGAAGAYPGGVPAAVALSLGAVVFIWVAVGRTIGWSWTFDRDGVVIAARWRTPTTIGWDRVARVIVVDRTTFTGTGDGRSHSVVRHLLLRETDGTRHRSPTGLSATHLRAAVRAAQRLALVPPGVELLGLRDDPPSGPRRA